MFPRAQRTTKSSVGPSPLPGPLAFPSPRFLRPPLAPCPHRPRIARSIRRPCRPSCPNRQYGCRHCFPGLILIVLLTTVDGPVFMAQSIHRPSCHSRRYGRHHLPPVFSVLVFILLTAMGGRRRLLFVLTPAEFIIVVVPSLSSNSGHLPLSVAPHFYPCNYNT